MGGSGVGVGGGGRGEVRITFLSSQPVNHAVSANPPVFDLELLELFHHPISIAIPAPLSPLSLPLSLPPSLPLSLSKQLL